jgi:hypothetical protein
MRDWPADDAAMALDFIRLISRLLTDAGKLDKARQIDTDSGAQSPDLLELLKIGG